MKDHTDPMVARLLSACLIALGMVGCDATAPQSTSVSSLPEVGELIEETGFYQSIKLFDEPPLYQKQSQFQKIEVVRSPFYGKILVLDGVVQLTEKDADAYNEMMAHMPMFQHKAPKRVLVIGGGDGYVLSEVLKHDSVTAVDHVDLDGDVVETCKEFFSWGNAWKDPRVTLHIADGAEFVRQTPDGYYDVIIQDSSDPWTWDDSGEMVELPSSVLYSKEHFHHLHRALSPRGILSIQAETIAIPSDFDGVAAWRNSILDVGFASAKYGNIIISSYPTGQIGFLMSEKSPKLAASTRDISRRFLQMRNADKLTTYYHPRLQASAFDLPLWAEQKIYGNDGFKSVCDAADKGDDDATEQM